MQVIRTIVWVVLLVILLLFSINNWNTVEVKIWEDLILETKLPALVIVAFLAGLIPMWLLHRANQWRLQRRITALETSLRTAIPPAPPATTALDTVPVEPAHEPIPPLG